MAEKLAFKTLECDEVFYLFNKRNKDLVDLFRNNNVGGPSIIFDRYQEVGMLSPELVLKYFLECNLNIINVIWRN